MAVDVELGKRVHMHLKGLGLETPMVNYEPHNLQTKGLKGGPIYDKIFEAQFGVMQALGLDLNDDSLADTPRRVAKMYAQEIFNGLDYSNFPKCTTVTNKMRYDEVVAVDGITIKSLCEHHFMPFIGTACIAYIPGTKVLGLSKFNRIAEFFSRRPQIQERLTEQIAATLRLILETDDVAVVIRAEHFCVKLRGVEDNGSATITSKMSGKFRDVPAARQELMALTRI